MPIFKLDDKIAHAIEVIQSTYGDNVSVDQKKKDLLKFGKRTTVGSTWETLMTTQGSELEETFVSTNAITTIVFSSSSDTGTVALEYHTISGGVLTFGVQTVTLTGQTGATLTTPCARVNRIYNTGANALVGNIAVYQGGSAPSGVPATKSQVHCAIQAGEQQSQKGATSISNDDYWIISNLSLSVLSKTAAYAEARLEVKPVGQSYWRPISQNFAAKDSSGTVQLIKEPFLIMPRNYDVRLAVKTNTGSIEVAGGFNGYLAKIIT